MPASSINSDYVYDNLRNMFPNAHCELNYDSVFHLAVAVILSAQTTDVSVNKVTPALFEKYPDAKALAEADMTEVENTIRSIGLYRNKARSIVNMAKIVNERYGGVLPDTMDELTELPGIGRKTANVILAEGFHKPGLAVDTHVHRVSWRLGITEKEDSPEKVEMALKSFFPPEKWGQVHHLMIFFGRYCCHSQKPECDNCPFEDSICKYGDKNK